MPRPFLFHVFCYMLIDFNNLHRANIHRLLGAAGFLNFQLHVFPVHLSALNRGQTIISHFKILITNRRAAPATDALWPFCNYFHLTRH
mgnify:CR=1 FL=1